MKRVFLEKNRCPQNHWCPIMQVCPTGAISQSSPFEAPQIDENKCINCGKCTLHCGYGAFTLADNK